MTGMDRRWTGMTDERPAPLSMQVTLQVASIRVHLKHWQSLNPWWWKLPHRGVFDDVQRWLYRLIGWLRVKDMPVGEWVTIDQAGSRAMRHPDDSVQFEIHAAPEPKTGLPTGRITWR